MHGGPLAVSPQFSDGQLVWAKCGKHPHWPARISGVLDEQLIEVEFFPDETAGFAEVHPSQVASWMGGCKEYTASSNKVVKIFDERLKLQLLLGTKRVVICF